MPTPAPLTVTAVYEAQVDFVWRSLRRLGVPAARIDDAVQDVFLVVHRRLSDFEARSSIKTWLFGIVLRVAHDHRRSSEREQRVVKGGALPDPDVVPDARTPGPQVRAEQADAIRLLEALLSEIGPEKREVFMLAELEEMTAPEIAGALGIPLSTVYARLRAARAEFEEALARRRAREKGEHDGSQR